PHPYDFFHDEPGFNYRLPNLNAALGCAQMEVLPMFLHQKRLIAEQYKAFFANTQYSFVEEPSYAKSNYWLNAVICPDSASRDRLLKETNEAGVMTRPVWKLMHHLPMFESSPRGDLTVSEWVEARLINIPSSPISLEV
ncbi:MAG: DegT/DnrJ/EryC1/StrS family aminotransferase, partial [Proteobacteria bacterium]|nr:DegT/DnrJ/EryC1/StrS family aminotransferase [Pseudomonadota bacterium]